MNTRICSMAILVAALAGCAQSSPSFEQGFGSAVRASVAQQVADPSAAANTNPVAGIDGRAAAAAQHRYESSYARPAEHQTVIPGQVK